MGECRHHEEAKQLTHCTAESTFRKGIEAGERSHQNLVKSFILKKPKPLKFSTRLGLTDSLQRGEGPHKTKIYLGKSYLIDCQYLGMG